MRQKESFTCQTPDCWRRRGYERAGDTFIVDPCQCGDSGYTQDAIEPGIDGRTDR